MRHIDIAKRIKEVNSERETLWQQYGESELPDNLKELYHDLTNKVIELNEELRRITKFDDLRLMTEVDVVVGQLVFGEYNNQIYAIIIDEILEDGVSFIADNCRYSVFGHYILKGKEIYNITRD